MKKHTIDKYWKKTPELFGNAYFKISPTSFFLRSRFSKIAPLFSHVNGKKVLDAGCGNGVFMREIIKNGGYVVGLDYSQDMLDEAQKQLQGLSEKSYKLICADVTKPLSFKKSEFDLVLASGLTDYISKEQNKNFLKEVSRILNSKGKFIITFPKKDSPFSFLRRGFGLKLRKLFLHLPPMLNSYSKKDIEILLESLGFVPEHFDTVFLTMWIVKGVKK